MHIVLVSVWIDYATFVCAFAANPSNAPRIGDSHRSKVTATVDVKCEDLAIADAMVDATDSGAAIARAVDRASDCAVHYAFDAPTADIPFGMRNRFACIDAQAPELTLDGRRDPE